VSVRLAIVFCVHHKPWLMMGTLLTLLSQDRRDADLFFAYNVGDGASKCDPYREYRQIAERAGENRQLSPFDARVREVCRLRGITSFEIEYENDHALDSGAWYKFIRDGRWRDYEYVLFAGEGLLFAHPRALFSMIAFADRRGADFIASGHEKRRLPRATMMCSRRRGQPQTETDAFHDRMVARTFEIFCRDPEFQVLYDRWGSDFEPETEHHVPGASAGGEWRRRLRGAVQRRWGSAYVRADVWWPARFVREAPHAIDRWRSRVRLRAAPDQDAGGPAMRYLGGGYGARPVDGQEIDCENGVAFHKVTAPEWFGCAVTQLMSRRLLDRFSERLDRFRLYDALDVPFAGSALEVVWGFVPVWLGVDKWFTNGLHRVRKHFATYQREDYPPEIASYVNRYHAGRLVVDWQGDYLKLEAWRPDLGDLRQVLPSSYFREGGARP
jgi:hypothetical protein